VEGIAIGLAALACPVGMGLMMWFMGKGMRGRSAEQRESASGSVDDLREEHERLGAEIEKLEREQHSGDEEFSRR